MYHIDCFQHVLCAVPDWPSHRRRLESTFLIGPHAALKEEEELDVGNEADERHDFPCLQHRLYVPVVRHAGHGENCPGNNKPRGFLKIQRQLGAMDETDLRVYMGLLILADVYRSQGEAAVSLWDGKRGRAIFRATMPVIRFYAYSRLLRFNDREMRHVRPATDKLAPIREVQTSRMGTSGVRCCRTSPTQGPELR